MSSTPCAATVRCVPADDDERATAPVPPAAETPLCSAKGCRARATVALVWRNPRLHTGDRVKRWAACPAHEEHLAQFLDMRGFLLGREELPR